MQSKKYEIHLVSHTHWDREWYTTFQRFRQKLVKHTDSLLEIMRKDPKYRYYVFDGQTIVLEDYAEIRPENTAKLKKLIRTGRLLVGPWYVQPDEFLVSAEALVRNLLIGHKIAKDYGGVMKVGYLPDIFGHISALPQILQGFDIDSFIFSRGLGREREEVGSEFIWQSRDGSELIAVLQVSGYANAAHLGCTGNVTLPGAHCFGGEEAALARARTGIDELKPFANTRCLLFNNGVDHVLPDPKLPEYIAYINANLKDAVVRHSTFPSFIEKLRPHRKEFKKLSGELRKGTMPLLPNVLSARMYIKQANFAAQLELEKYTEPLSVFALLEGMRYESSSLELAWKHLIQTHPHDSICGCSIDEVHRDVMVRFVWSRQICASLEDDCVIHLLGVPEAEGKDRVAVFNTLPWARAADITLGEETYSVEVPACGFKVCAKADLRKAGPMVSGNTLENAFVKVEAAPNGVLTLTDKRTGNVYSNLNYFEDTEDCGDEYNYSWAANSRTLTTLSSSPSIAAVDGKLVIAHTFVLPKSLTSDRQGRSANTTPVSVKTTVLLDTHSPVVRLSTEIDNTALDHRLRAGFDPGLKAVYSLAESQFDVVRRAPKPDPKDFTGEIPLGTHPQQNFVAIADGGKGLVIANKGLPEYELTEDYKLYVTLIRACGWLSRPDLATRSGDAGPSFPTPEAQCQGVNTYEYALIPYTGGWESCLRDIYGFVAPVRTFEKVWNHVLAVHQGMALVEKSYFSLEPANLILSALKKAENGNGIIIRLFNPTDKPVTAVLACPMKLKSVWLVKLSEARVKKLPVRGTAVQTPVKPGQVVTLKLVV